MVYNVQTVIDIALKEVGYLEKSKSAYQKNKNVLNMKEDGAGSENYTKYGKELSEAFPGKVPFPAAWCDCFTDWCFYKAYGKANVQALLAGDVCGLTSRSAQLYINKNAWYTSDPKPGDQIFFKNSSGEIYHTGLVYEVRDGKVFTVEGNTSSAAGVVANGGCVRSKSYSLSYAHIAGYGRPRYDENAATSQAETPNAGWQNLVMELQKALNAEFGTNLPINGVADNRLLMATPSLSARIRSTKPKTVMALQNLLSHWGYPCKADGDYYNATEKMTKSFQRDKVGLANPDGEFTAQKRSWKVLLKL